NKGVTEYQYTPSCGNCGSHASGISVDGLGQIWLDDSLQGTFGSFPIGGGSFSFYATRGHPHDGLNVDTQNRIWFDEEFASKLTVAIQSRSEEHTSELQSRRDLVCRLLLEKKKIIQHPAQNNR